MLVIVPYLVRHPGASVAETARLFYVPEDQLRTDLLPSFPPRGSRRTVPGT